MYPGLLRTGRFWKHYAAMVAAMFAGMMLLMPLAMLLPGAAEDALDTPVGASLVMATTMSIGMTAYMAWSRHSWAPIIAMDGVMYASFIIFFPALGAGWMGGDAVLTLGHIVMLPAMVVVMVLTHHHTHQTVGASA